MVLLLLICQSIPVYPSHAETFFSKDASYKLSEVFGSDGRDTFEVSKADSQGNIYIASNVYYMTKNTTKRNPFYYGPIYPIDPYITFNVTDGAYSTEYNPYGTITLTKLNPEGKIIWSTYFGGKYRDTVKDMIITHDNRIILTGDTTSSNFPVVNGTRNIHGEISTTFISIFSSDGELLKSTYFGGSYYESILKMKVDDQDNLIVAGFTKSDDFPLVNPLFGRIKIEYNTSVAFITKLDKNLNITFSTEFGGDGTDIAFDFALGPNNTVIVVGSTRSSNFPITDNAMDSTPNGKVDSFYLRFSFNGSVEVSTLFGGLYYDYPESVVVDSTGNAYITGYTDSSNFPTKNAEDTVLNNGQGRSSDCFVMKVNYQGNIEWSTYYGGGKSDYAVDIELSQSHFIIVSGITRSSDFPIFGVKNPELAINQGKTYKYGDPPQDVFISKFSQDGILAWSIVFGSTGMDYLKSASMYNDNELLISGHTLNIDDFPRNNTFTGGYLYDGYFTLINIPDVTIPANFLGYKQVLFQTTTSKFEDFNFDILSYIGLGIIILVVLNRIYKIKIKPWLEKRSNKAGKDETIAYMDKLRES